MFHLKIFSPNYLLVKEGQADEGKCYGIINGSIRVYKNENHAPMVQSNDELNRQNIAEKIANNEFGRHVATLDFRDMKTQFMKVLFGLDLVLDSSKYS